VSLAPPPQCSGDSVSESDESEVDAVENEKPPPVVACDAEPSAQRKRAVRRRKPCLDASG
jgi:hypothetical protein